MKQKIPVFVFVLIFYAAGNVFAADIASLDKVSIFMPKSKVLSILGASQETLVLAEDLKVEVYPVESVPPLVHAGCIYDKNGILMGQSFVFHGHTAHGIADRLKKHGFTPLPQKDGSLRLAGVDDDTGRPLVAVIAENDHLTTLTTFEKAFYEGHVQ